MSITSQKLELTFKIKTDADNKIGHNKNSRRNKIQYDKIKYFEKQIVWNLKMLDRTFDDGLDWQYKSPVKKLNENLTSKKIVECLNAKNVFEFNYEPKDTDLLEIRYEYVIPKIKNKERPYIGDYIIFEFKNKKWKINDGFETINNIYRTFKSGGLYVAQQCI